MLLLMGLMPKPAAGASCPCTIWPGSATPSQVTVNDPNAVELGVKFSPDVAGSITGIRFYKGPQNTGTHTGSLWSTSGARLATATFTSETASGWQQVNFASPVNVTANTTYVASYYAPVGNYSANGDYFAAVTDNSPLHAPSSAASGGNGVYAYGADIFPVLSFNNTNYWVDVVFSTTTVPDTTSPTVAITTPFSGATNVGASSDVSAVFSEDIDPATVNTSTFELRNPANNLVGAIVSYNAAAKTTTLNPTADLASNTAYTATLKGGGTDPRIKDVAGNALAASYSWSFTTSSSAPLDQGPGGPILVIKSDSQPFSKYNAEILRAEGLNSFATADVSTVTSTMLNQYDVVVLGEVSLTTAQVTLLTNWVNAGGNLIAMRPDKKLANLLGLTDQASTLSNAYLLASTAAAPGAGITDQTIQFHGVADKYALKSGTSAVATLYSNATIATTNPAVTMRSVGSNGGQAAAFTYDLAKSVIYTHQGNPAWAGQERDGLMPIRPDDLFFGAKVGDVQPDWVDLNKVAIPQADEQQRLLANMVNYMNQDRKPIPKFWYFPKGGKAVIVMAGDDHATANGTVKTFNNLLANSPVNCSVANWECLRATSWIYTDTPVTDTQAANYRAQGFDIGSHISSGCSDWTPASLADNFTSDLTQFRAKYTSLPPQQGNRLHCLVWSDWATLPKVELNNGIRIDMGYYYWPGSWVQNRPGFMTGSGMAMRYGDADGSMIDVYQLPSHLVNESGMTYPQAINTVLDRALGPEGYYGVFGTHYDYSDSFDQQLMASAQARNVPLVSAQQMLDWTDGRNNSSMTQIAWSGSTLNFTASVDGRAGTMLRSMLPLTSSKGTLTGITQNGSPLSYTVDTLKGVSYAIFPASSGTFAATYAVDTTPPTVTVTSPVAGATNVPTSANMAATFSEAMNAATISTTTFELRDPSNALVPAAVTYDSANKVAALDPVLSLTGGATYTATVKGGSSGVKDVAGNALATNRTWSFTAANGPVCPCSLWAPSATPALITANDTQAVELGVKFTADRTGTVSAIRFYKGPQNTGTHTITLWNTAGTALAAATVTNETASGWQTMTFSSPVAINANTTYVASYFAPVGSYSADVGYFANPLDNPPLHVPGAGSGVYKYGGGFPTSTFNNTNYWVDVVFN